MDDGEEDVAGVCWLEEVVKALVEGRGECLGCWVGAFSAVLDAPKYPSEKD